MSSPSSNPNVSSLQFHHLFDAALREYRQKTGNDFEKDPLTNRFRDCDPSAEAVLDILEEQVRAFDQFRKGDRKIQLMRRLKPIVDILLGLSSSGVTGVAVQGISLVRTLRLNYHL